MAKAMTKETGRIMAVLGPTNTGKTHYAIERMLGHRTGVIGLPLRLLAREVYDKCVALRGPSVVAPSTAVLNVLIRLDGEGQPPAARPAIDLALVVDRSGSMSGDKIHSVKRAALDVIHAGTVHPGKYLVLIGGTVADVEEAMDAAFLVAADHVVDRMFLPDPHPQLAAALTGTRQTGEGEALGIVETDSVAAAIRAADAGLKGAAVTLREIFMADGLGGKGYLLFSGALTEVQAATEAAAARAGGELIADRIIAQLHDEMDERLVVGSRFGVSLGTSG